jgi:hypothetical protein
LLAQHSTVDVPEAALAGLLLCITDRYAAPWRKGRTSPPPFRFQVTTGRIVAMIEAHQPA